MKILSQKEKIKIVEQLNKQFGIKEIKGIFSMRGKERLFLFQGDFSVQQIKEFEYSRINIERVGIYFGKFMDTKIRLSIEGVELLKTQITKNVFELNKEQLEKWMKGNELNIKTEKNDFVIMKYRDDFLGCGKASAEKITNFIPKNRRLKEKNEQRKNS
jgi:NOL1/NOP2/fmu family ribosome biogenesis protein